MLKTTKSIGFVAESKEIKARVGNNSIVSNSKVIYKISFIKGKNQAKMTKSKILIKSKNHDFPPNSKNMEAGLGFLIFEARLAFIEALILHFFNSKYHIQIEINASGYVINKILSQLTSNDSS